MQNDALNEVLRRAYGIECHDHVLDMGCGAGETTREATRLAAEGGALGVDLSAEAIARARDRSTRSLPKMSTILHGHIGGALLGHAARSPEHENRLLHLA